MTSGERIRKAVEECGLRVATLAKRAGISPQAMHNIVGGTEPREQTVAAIETVFAQYAQALQNEEYPATPHPGATDLAADADLCEAYHVSEEELAGLRECVVIWKGQPLVVRSKYAAASLLEAIRRIVGEREG